MDKEQFRYLPNRLEVRELQYRVHRKGFRVTMITPTTLLDLALGLTPLSMRQIGAVIAPLSPGK